MSNTTTFNRTLQRLSRWLDAPKPVAYYERVGVEDHIHPISPVAVTHGARPLR